MQQITFHKVDVPGPLLGRGSLWFDSCNRPPGLFILGRRLQELRLYLVRFSFCLSLLWELRDNGVVKNTQFSP